MGLFSKKTVTCEKCGKEYQIRVDLGEHLCEDCAREKKEKKEYVKGYIDYAFAMKWPDYTEAQLEEIADHRDGILEKYRMTVGISRSELREVSENYKNLSDEQAADILKRVSHTSVRSTVGSAFNGLFFMLTTYENVVVDTDSVFAVGYVSDYKVQADGHDVILCAVFTNDPYVPVFPMVYVSKLGFFEITKSKKGRESVAGLFEAMCPNLTYPVQELKHLKKQIMSEGMVIGNLDQEFMLEKISDALFSSKIFNIKNMHTNLSPSAVTMLNFYGYIPEEQIDQIMMMDKMFNRNFWTKQMKKMNQEQ